MGMAFSRAISWARRGHASVSGGEGLPKGKTGPPNSANMRSKVDLSLFRQQMDSAMARFLVIEVEVGIGFARAAHHALWTRDLLHNRELARKAYDTALQRMDHVRLAEREAKRLMKDLQKLRLALYQLGDPVLSVDPHVRQSDR